MIPTSEDPFNPGEISVTIKHDGKDAPWIVFKGSVEAVRQQIIAAFSMNDEAVEMNLHELTVEASRMAKGASNAAAGLGGRVIKENSAWSKAKSEAPVEVEQPAEEVTLADLIAKAESRDELKELFKENNAAIKADADLFAALKAKGNSLPA